MNLIITALLLAYATLHVKCEYFSATDDLEMLADVHSELVETLSEVIKNNSNNLEFFKRRLKFYQQENKFMKEDITKFVTNPLNAFLLIKSLTFDIELIKSHGIKNLENFNLSSFDFGIDNAEIDGAVEGLIKLQETYRLKTSDLAAGVVDGEKTRPPLSVEDLALIGLKAFQLNIIKYPIDYLNLALNDLPKLDQIDRAYVNETFLLQTAMQAFDRMKDYKSALTIAEKLLLKNPNDNNRLWIDRLSKLSQNQGAIIDPYPNEFNKTGKYSYEKETILFNKICRDEYGVSQEELAKLRCGYRTTNAFTKIAPFKFEEAKLSPYIIVFHDILSDAEIEALKILTKPKSYRGTINKDGNSTVVSKHRVAKLAWHTDASSPVVARISRRTEDMTGLTTQTAETLQVQNYGIGGLYVPHFDYHDNRYHWEAGNRIATTLYYMSNVHKGGQTVFPYLGVRVTPKKGTMVFWFNVNESGEQDPSTRHAACPVLLGTKWVANKWIHEFGQEFRRPCGLKYKEPNIDYFENYL